MEKYILRVSNHSGDESQRVESILTKAGLKKLEKDVYELDNREQGEAIKENLGTIGNFHRLTFSIEMVLCDL